MKQTRRVSVSSPPPPTPTMPATPMMPATPTLGLGRSRMDALPDAVTVLGISWLDRRTYARACRLSHRFRKLSRLPAAAPADVRVVLDARAGNATCVAATAWLLRMTPRTVALEFRDANAIDPALLKPGTF